MSKLFLFFCTLLSIFISVSGLLSIKSATDLPPHLAFLPVTLYLITSSLKQLSRTRIAPEVKLSGKKIELLMLFLIFISLISLGIKSVQSASQPTLPTPSPQPIIIQSVPSTTPEPVTGQEPTLTVFHEDPNTLVNIRSSPSTASTLIEKVPVGNSYSFTQLKDGWYEIQLTSTSSGWLFGQYATISAQQQ